MYTRKTTLDKITTL